MISYRLMEQVFAAFLRPDILASLIGALATIAAGTLGVLVVVWQIGEQARIAISQNRDNEAVKLKLRVYEEVAEICKRASDAEIMLASFIRGFANNVRMIQTWQAQGVPWSTPRERFAKFQELSSDFANALNDAIFVTERWQVIDPRFDLFRYALNAAMHDVRELEKPYVPFIVQAMPMETPPDIAGQTKLFPWRIPDVERLSALTESLSDALGTCGAYIGDMQVEMQNQLIGDLFGHRVSPREPLDPRLIAIRLDRYEALKTYFETKSAWGMNAQRVMSEVKANLARRDGGGEGGEPPTPR